jgi:hypothetical protein
MIKDNMRHWKLILEALGNAQPIIAEDVMPSASISDAQATDNPAEVKYFLPTIKITEDWGKIGSKDRQIIEKFTRNIEGDTLEAKLSNINKVITERSAATIPQILGTMVVVEILNSVLREFTESAGGFIFEGFLAGLFGGESVQITDTKDQEEAGEATEAAGKPITDVVLGGREYSLKLLGQSTAVKGSFKNMVEHFRVKDHIVYLDARRIHGENSDGSKGAVKGLEFGEFVITRENFMKVFMDPFLKDVIKQVSEVSTARGNLRATNTGQKLKNDIRNLRNQGKALKGISWPKAYTKADGTRIKYPSTGNAITSIAYKKPTGEHQSPDSLETENLTEGLLLEKAFEPPYFDQEIDKFLSLSNSELTKLVQNPDYPSATDTRGKHFGDGKFPAAFVIAYADKKFEGTKAEALFGSFAIATMISDAAEQYSIDKEIEPLIDALMRAPGYIDKMQFDFTRKQAESIAGFKSIGELSISPETLQETWLAYGDVLSQTVAPIYKALSEFNENINSFLTEEQNEDGNRKEYGLKAGSNAKDLKSATDSAVQQVTQVADVPSE